jgi:hypothetical protein
MSLKDKIEKLAKGLKQFTDTIDYLKPNYDYGEGLYSNLDKYKDVDSFLKQKRKDRAARIKKYHKFINKNASDKNLSVQQIEDLFGRLRTVYNREDKDWADVDLFEKYAEYIKNNPDIQIKLMNSPNEMIREIVAESIDFEYLPLMIDDKSNKVKDIIEHRLKMKEYEENS